MFSKTNTESLDGLYSYHKEKIAEITAGWMWGDGEHKPLADDEHGFLYRDDQGAMEAVREAMERGDELLFQPHANVYQDGSPDPKLEIYRLKEGWRDCPFADLPTQERIKKARMYWEQGMALEDIEDSPTCPECGSIRIEEQSRKLYAVGSEKPAETLEWVECENCGHAWERTNDC